MRKKTKKNKSLMRFRLFYLALAVLAIFITTYVTVKSNKSVPTMLTHAYTYTNATTTYNKKVYVIIFNPILLNNQTVVSYKRYNDPNRLVNDYIAQFKKITNNRVNYSVAYTSQANYIPVKIDGYQYTPQEYAAVISGTLPHHNPDTANYYQFINNSTYDICGKVNKGQVDEVWLMGGPWMGFHESTMLSGPNSRKGFPYNSDPTSLTTCKKLIPVMGFNYEVGIDQMLHSFGHRVEATLNYLYGTPALEKTRTDWELYAHNASANIPSGPYGCGNIHYPPNIRSSGDGYQYSLSNSVTSYCDSFYSYPYTYPLKSKTITCSEWGCTQLGYQTWWLSHIPHYANSNVNDSDGYIRSNDWWSYIMDLNTLYVPSRVTFTNLSAKLTKTNATFSYKYTGFSPDNRVHLASRNWDDIYLSFGVGRQPVDVQNPMSKWNKYVCGATLYWRVENMYGDMSPVQMAVVNCASGT